MWSTLECGKDRRFLGLDRPLDMADNRRGGPVTLSVERRIFPPDSRTPLG